MTGSKALTYGAAIGWGTLLGIRLQQVARGDWLALLLAAQAGIVAGALVMRREPHAEIRIPWRIFAWGSAIMPLALTPGGVSLLPSWIAGAIGAAGLIVAIWGLMSLGRSFGIAPADRGLITTGAYRWLRHPAYSGELGNILAYVMAHLSMWNLLLVGLIGSTLFLRIHLEEKLVDGYRRYALVTRWRLLPGIW